MAFLEETDTYDWIARSIMVRILKEAERKQEYLQMLKDSYNFDPATPSLIPFDAEAGRPGLPPAKKLDVHTLNTVMNHFKQTDDLSKMVSLFETATAPAPHKAKELKDASDVPFFHSNSDGDLPIYSFVTGEAIPQPRRETKTRSSAMQPVPAATHPSGQSISNTPSEKLRFTLPSEPFTLTNVNAYTIGLLIREATRLGHIHLAFHYTKQAHALWEQERTRLRKACQKLHDLQRKQISRLTQEQMLDLLPTQVAASRVSMSVHTMQPLYEMAKKGANGSGHRHRHVLVFRACMELAYQIVETLKRDTVFWARVCDNMEEVRAALDDLSRRAYHSRVSDREGLADYREKKLDLKTHLLLQTRLKLEMNALANKLDIATTDVLAYKKAHAIMNELKVEKLAPAEMSGATEKQLTTFISQMQKRVKKARNWTLQDTLQDAWRLQLTRKLGKSLSTRQLSRLLKARGEKYQRRRAKVRVAIVKAQDAIKAAMVAITDLREAAELQAKAQLDLDARNKAEAEASMQQVPEAQTANESAKEQGNVTIQAASQYGSPGLILC